MLPDVAEDKNKTGNLDAISPLSYECSKRWYFDLLRVSLREMPSRKTEDATQPVPISEA